MQPMSKRSIAFPGMNPFLEMPIVWPQFHSMYLSLIYQTILPSLVSRYRAKIRTRQYVSELVLFTTVQRETHEEDYIEIRERSSGELVTLIELVTPGNRSTPQGRDAYWNTRKMALAEHANTVELDLCLQGRPMLDFDRSNLPRHHYTIAVTRSESPERFEVYARTLLDRLPKMKFPLASDDRAAVVDLQMLMERCQAQSEIQNLLDYSQGLPPDVVLAAEDRAWLATQLQQTQVE